ETIEEPLLHHDATAAKPFLGRLKDEMDLAGEIAMLAEVARGAEQHRGMAVVSAGVHFPGYFRGIVEPRRLANMQRVEIRPEADRALAGPRALQRADEAGLGDSLGDVDAPGAKFVGHQPRRTTFLEADFGMTMDVAADRDELRLVAFELFGQRGAHP